MTRPTDDVAAVLARGAIGQEFINLAPSTVRAVEDVLFDSLAVALAGTHAPGVAQARDALTAWGGDGASIWGVGRTASPPVAAILNAASLHALDYDDTDDGVPLHANSVVLPVLLADLEARGADCTGRDFITALAVGIDGAMRIGRSGGPRGSRGWNYSVISGGMGAVLAVGRLRGWDADVTVHALGHQLAQTSGSLQSIIDGSLAKRFQPAMVAKDVLVSAALAEAGIDGPANVFEGRAGFFALYQDGQYSRDVLLSGREESALVGDLSLKPYPSCRFTHAAIDLALRMREEGVKPDQVRSIELLTSQQAYNMVGRTFDPATAGIVDAQFSITYTASVALHRGQVLISDFLPDRISDRTVGGFASSRMAVTATDTVPFLAMAPMVATVHMDDGTKREFETTTVSGSPEDRMSPGRLKAKAADCLSHGRSAVTVEELWDAVHELADGVRLTRLLGLVQRPAMTGAER